MLVTGVGVSTGQLHSDTGEQWGRSGGPDSGDMWQWNCLLNCSYSFIHGSVVQSQNESNESLWRIFCEHFLSTDR